MYGKNLRWLASATVLALGTAFTLVFFYAPNDVDQGFVQKIFYVHVPLAIVALCGFVAAGVFGIQHLRTRDEAWDARSYVAIHMSVIFGVAVLVTGAIWAKASWGKWWVWDEPTLVSFLIVFLLYVTYYPLRYSIDDPGRRARFSSAFAIFAGAFVPINFLAVRLAENLVHPRVLNATAGDMPGEMRFTFLLALAGVALLYVTLFKLELTAKHTRMQLGRLRRALETPRGAARARPRVTVPAKPDLMVGDGRRPALQHEGGSKGA
ncbi:MAG: cytochrome c biogenesis protein [Solirubrobacterales bacterium]